MRGQTEVAAAGPRSFFMSWLSWSKKKIKQPSRQKISKHLGTGKKPIRPISICTQIKKMSRNLLTMFDHVNLSQSDGSGAKFPSSVHEVKRSILG